MKPTYQLMWAMVDCDENTYYLSGYTCKKCKVAYSEHDHEWTLPDNFRMTDKQCKAIMFISNRLRQIKHSEYLITKQQAIQFISKYLPIAQKVELDYDADWDEYNNDLYYAMRDE